MSVSVRGQTSYRKSYTGKNDYNYKVGWDEHQIVAWVHYKAVTPSAKKPKHLKVRVTLKGLPLFAMDIKYTQDIAKAIAPPKCYIQLKAVRT